ncbi:hypothetical protein [Nocardia sp. NPDC050412]|uniref:hypothetical protein n=1 Tax=Nocardia sp. NPDC050412 TaxID=3364320 RepID=UPI0037AB4373
MALLTVVIGVAFTIAQTGIESGRCPVSDELERELRRMTETVACHPYIHVASARPRRIRPVSW